MTEEHRRAVAWHEAGHAATAALLGVSLRYVRLCPDDPDADGLCVPRGCFRLRRVRPLAELYIPEEMVELLFKLAGMAAQRLVEPDADDAEGVDDLDGIGSDLIGWRPDCPAHREAWEAARAAILAYGRLWAAAWVRECRDCIAAVADALLERGELTGQEVRQIVARVLREQMDWHRREEPGRRGKRRPAAD